jgi:hypothetical protein
MVIIVIWEDYRKIWPDPLLLSGFDETIGKQG